MKIWNGYGSEHSMNLVMIGHFKNLEDAEQTQHLFDELSKELEDKIDFGDTSDRFSNDALKILREKKCFLLRPFELEQFLYDIHTKLEGNKIVLETDESDISAFLKLMIEKGAKVEIYSAHDYPKVK